MLADLKLTELPDDVLSILASAIHMEREKRRAVRVVETRQQRFSRIEASLCEEGCLSYTDAIVRLASTDASRPAALYGDIRRRGLKHRLRYLPVLLAQDWETAFPEADQAQRVFYVYAHVDPRKPIIPLEPLQVILKGKPFYIGKGCGERAWELRRNDGHGKRLRALRHIGYRPSEIVQIIAEDLTEREAFALESKLIYFFGSLYELNTAGMLTNLDDYRRPVFTTSMDKVPSQGEYQRVQRYRLQGQENFGNDSSVSRGTLSIAAESQESPTSAPAKSLPRR